MRNYILDFFCPECKLDIELDGDKLQDLGKVFVRYPHVDFVFYMFRQDFSHRPTVRLSDEHQDYRWVTFDEALDLPLISGAKEVIDQIQTLVGVQ